jgi:hypothetical protein
MPVPRRLVPLLVLATLSPAGPAAAGPPAVALPLAAPRPAWLTPELERQVRSAGIRGVPLPPSALPVAPAGTDLRPGTWIVSPSSCTLGFVLTTDGGDFHPAQQLYAATAGQCAEVGDDVIVATVPPGASAPVLVAIGRTVRTGGGGSPGDDVAIIAIEPGLNAWVSPAMAVWGGPRPADPASTATAVVYASHGTALGAGQAHTGVLAGPAGTTGRVWTGPAPSGAAGAPVDTADGRAMAMLTHLMVDARGPATAYGVAVARVVQFAGHPLATCPVARYWPLPGCPPA